MRAFFLIAASGFRLCARDTAAQNSVPPPPIPAFISLGTTRPVCPATAYTRPGRAFADIIFDRVWPVGD